MIGCTQSFFKKWILHQPYADMTEENYGSVWTLDHCYALPKTDLPTENDMNKSTHGINLRPTYTEIMIAQRGLKLIIDYI